MMLAWVKRHPLAALGALALALRVAAAVVTESHPIFPPYYYTDARVFHEDAASALDDEAHGRPPVFKGPRSVRVQSYLLYELYRVTGPRPLAGKLANAAAGAAGIVLLAWALAFVFPPSAAYWSGALAAVWPSHVFYTSQCLKESPSIFLAYAALGCALGAGAAPRLRPAPRLLLAVAAAAAMLASGFLRPPVLAALAFALFAAAAFALARESKRRLQAVAAAAAVGAALFFYARLSRDTALYEYQLVPAVSPAELTKYRDTQEWVARTMAVSTGHGEVGTSLFPDQKFFSWSDLMLFLPKGAFYVLFMPLPGLYPMGGKIGRIAAAGENTLLLAVALLAAFGIARGKLTSERLALLAFFAVLTAGAAVLEFDLGGAARHKLLYLPMLFPFALEEAARLARRVKG